MPRPCSTSGPQGLTINGLNTGSAKTDRHFQSHPLRPKHLDSMLIVHHDVRMRTTVTLDKDVERLLREAMHRSRRGFKETLNAAIRNGLGRKTTGKERSRFVVRARPMGLRAGLDPAGLNKLADDLDVDTFLSKVRNAKTK
jgi:hypothetical protein